MIKSSEPELLVESLAAYYAENPAVMFRVAWAAYANNFLPLAEAAAALGGTFEQFLELGEQYTADTSLEIPVALLNKASLDEKFLLRCLPQRLIDVLQQLLVKDILLPMSNRYLGTLGEDMRFLKRLKLVRAAKRANLYQYSLNLKHSR